jgi:hypothetical protein
MQNRRVALVVDYAAGGDVASDSTNQVSVR